MRGPQGFRGPEGLRGANGADGQDGAPGTPASATLLQGRATQSPFTTSGSGADADLPLQSGTFQQPATGTVLLVAQATFTSPANWSSTACPNGTPGLTTNSATVDVLVDGVKSGSLTTNFSPTENSVAKTTVLDPRTIAVDAGSASARTVTVKARDGCADRDFQITGLRVNVYSLG
jgi:hypothetical protein